MFSITNKYTMSAGGYTGSLFLPNHTVSIGLNSLSIDNTLSIHSAESITTTPLLEGKFDSRTIKINGGLAVGTTTKTGGSGEDYPVGSEDGFLITPATSIVLCDVSSTAVKIYLPNIGTQTNPLSSYVGFGIQIVHSAGTVSSNNITIAGETNATVTGTTTISTANTYITCTVIANDSSSGTCTWHCVTGGGSGGEEFNPTTATEDTDADRFLLLDSSASTLRYANRGMGTMDHGEGILFDVPSTVSTMVFQASDGHIAANTAAYGCIASATSDATNGFQITTSTGGMYVITLSMSLRLNDNVYYYFYVNDGTDDVLSMVFRPTDDVLAYTPIIAQSVINASSAKTYTVKIVGSGAVVSNRVSFLKFTIYTV
jgi:hypothetical protein